MDLVALNNALAHLLADGTTFDGAEADLLIANLPINSRGGGLSLQIRRRGQGPLRDQFAMAGGARIFDDRRDAHIKTIDTSGEWMHVGMYRVQHAPRLISIRLATPANRIDEEKEVLLRYDRRGHATRLEGSYEHHVTIFRARFTVVLYRTWKRRA